MDSTTRRRRNNKERQYLLTATKKRGTVESYVCQRPEVTRHMEIEFDYIVCFFFYINLPFLSEKIFIKDICEEQNKLCTFWHHK